MWTMPKKVERFFWIIAAIALATYALAVLEKHAYQVYLDRQFVEMPELPAPTLQQSKLVEGQVLGRLEISSIHLSAMIAEGVSSSTLRHGIGRVPGTALPGSNGNVTLAAHRDSFFRDLGKLHKNDQISVTTLAGTFHYAVESTNIVDPDEVVVMRNIGRPTMTLVTCYPFYFVGPAPKRFVVHAALMESE
jgi:sortase A